MSEVQNVSNEPLDSATVTKGSGAKPYSKVDFAYVRTMLRLTSATDEELAEPLRVLRDLEEQYESLSALYEQKIARVEELSEQLEAAQRVIDANAAESYWQVVARAEAVEEQLETQYEIQRSDAKEYVELKEQLEALDAWASRMPDAGFTSDDPRWEWWHQRPRISNPAKDSDA